jgi:ubiquinone/menaquinone biosynthesis C-methylase UbiE
MAEDRYTHGHQPSVVNAHATRTIENSAAYLVPHLSPGMSLLDVGCGPGSITAQFVDRLGPQGRVLGIDLSDDVISTARARHPDSGAQFETMDLYALDIADDSFDIAHAHQVLQHVSDPVAALVEMRRVVRPGGVIAVRDADYAAMHWAPESPTLERWQSIYRRVAHANDAEPDAGRHLLRWARQAGFTDITPSVDTWLYATPERREWWGSTWAERVVSSSLADQAVEGGFADRGELEAIADGWRVWIQEPDGWFVVVHGQLLCRVN